MAKPLLCELLLVGEASLDSRDIHLKRPALTLSQKIVFWDIAFSTPLVAQLLSILFFVKCLLQALELQVGD